MPEESPQMADIRANENIMQQRLYGVVATLAAISMPSLEASIASDDEPDEMRMQALQELQGFVSLHLETEELKAAVVE